jgi:hypothetical protein
MLDYKMTGGLLVARPLGTVDAQTAEEIVDFIEIKEEELETGFNRFCDLTFVEGIKLSCLDIFLLASRRREFNPNSIPVKSAFLAINPLAVGIARMYEQMLDSPRIEVRVWRDLEQAAGWLEVKPESLKFDTSNASDGRYWKLKENIKNPERKTA